MGRGTSVFAVVRPMVADELLVMDRGRSDLEEVELKFDG